jgi:hypothetical protein
VKAIYAVNARADFLGNFCWNLDPFIDNIELAVTENGGHFLVHGKWVATSAYFIPVVGNASVEGSTAHLGLHGTNNTTAFSGFNDCTMDAILDLTTLTGPQTIDCGAGGFTGSATLVPIACPIPDNVSPDGGAGSMGGQ